MGTPALVIERLNRELKDTVEGVIRATLRGAQVPDFGDNLIVTYAVLMRE